MNPFWIGIWIGAGLLIAIVAIAALIRSNDFAIRGRRGQKPRFFGHFPEIYRVPFSQFLESEIEEENWTIRGAFKDRRFIRLRFSGNLHPFTRQRVRNFLMSLLHP